MNAHLALAQWSQLLGQIDEEVRPPHRSGGSGGFGFGGLLSVIGLWKVFSKAGKPGWAAIVPIYNLLVLLSVINKPWWWLLLYLVPIVNLYFIVMTAWHLATAFGKGIGFTIGLLLLAPIFLLILGFGDAQYGG